MTRFYFPSTSVVSTGLLLLALSASAPASAVQPSTSAVTETSPSSTSPMYDPKSTCESMGITNIDECVASCLMYFPEGVNNVAFGPFKDNEPLHPQFCKCNGINIGHFVAGEADRYICGATTDVYFTCADVNVTDVSTCDDTCKQDTSTPGTTFHGGWYEEYQMCECMADVPNSGVFNYCGGPPPPPAGGVLPTCQSLAIFGDDDCESYCRDYARVDYPQIEYYDDPNLVGGGMSCLCSTGSGCKDENGSPSSSSSSSSLRGYVAQA